MKGEKNKGFGEIGLREAEREQYQFLQLRWHVTRRVWGGVRERNIEGYFQKSSS